MDKYKKEIIGINLIVISILILFSLFGYNEESQNKSNFLSIIATNLIFYLGIGSYMLPILMGMYGFLYFTGKDISQLIYLKISAHLLGMGIWLSTVAIKINKYLENPTVDNLRHHHPDHNPHHEVQNRKVEHTILLFLFHHL